jgi:DNA invertase Pin-like site-specific DNA recombinase
VAIYLRVSKDDGSQETDNQLLQLRRFSERWEGHELVAEYVDWESGTRGRREQKDFDRMFADAARRRFDMLLFWLDRFSREAIRKTIAYLQRLDDCGVSKSHIEPFLDTDNELIAHIVLGVTSYYAQQGAMRISDRIKAGLERTRRQGKVLRRPDGSSGGRPCWPG